MCINTCFDLRIAYDCEDYINIHVVCFVFPSPRLFINVLFLAVLSVLLSE